MRKPEAATSLPDHNWLRFLRVRTADWGKLSRVLVSRAVITNNESCALPQEHEILILRPQCRASIYYLGKQADDVCASAPVSSRVCQMPALVVISRLRRYVPRQHNIQ